MYFIKRVTPRQIIDTRNIPVGNHLPSARREKQTVKIPARRGEAIAHKQSVVSRGSRGWFSPSAFPSLVPSSSRRELHSRVYHCPDNNDLPTDSYETYEGTVGGRNERTERRETRTSGGEGWRRGRSATLHSEVFHFNGPPGDWLTPAPSPFTVSA